MSFEFEATIANEDRGQVLEMRLSELSRQPMKVMSRAMSYSRHRRVYSSLQQSLRLLCLSSLMTLQINEHECQRRCQDMTAFIY